ncbi:MAG: GNAT family N-acetyltransferase [Bacteroidales bacterium]|nr:GNAT family N-acetyltransferase [Bacteroidales bacterium]MBQ9313228.1 GNAT family N-acetyltransferase [Bacteroidales bacterium]
MFNKDFSLAKNLYENAFPENERRSLSSLDNLVENSPYFHFLPIHENNSFAGFATVWNFSQFIYIEHFAILPKLRNMGIGSRFLKNLQDKYQKAIVLEVELPDNDIAKNRVSFYQRLGFKLLPDFYMQPAYSKEKESIEMKVMLYSKENSQTPSFQTIKDILYKQVYNVE